MLCYVSIQWVLSVGITWALDFIHHIPYVVDACALHCPWQIWFIVYPRRKQRPRRIRESVSSFDWYGFRFSISLWNVFKVALRDSVMFSVAQRVSSQRSPHTAHTSSHLNYMNLPVYYLIRRWVFSSNGRCDYPICVGSTSTTAICLVLPCQQKTLVSFTYESNSAHAATYPDNANLDTKVGDFCPKFWCPCDMGMKVRNWQEAGEYCIRWSFVTCRLHQILLG
jgi:hypothetical protein